MNDTQPGPGWWLASDGRWYPPESYPRQLPPPPTASSAPPGGPPPMPVTPPAMHQPVPPGYAAFPYAQAHPVVGVHGVSGGLGGTIQGFFWALAAVAAVAAVLSLAALSAFNSYWDTPIDSRAEARAYDDWLAIDDTFSAFAGFTVICGLVLFVLMIIWMHSAHKATQQLWQGHRQWTSGWTVGGWFIPVANLVIPKLVLSEIERIAFAPRASGRVDGSFTARKVAPVGTAWWLTYVAATVLVAIGAALSGDDVSDSELRAGYVVTSAGFAVLVASGVLGALYVRRLGRRLSASGLSESP